MTLGLGKYINIFNSKVCEHFFELSQVWNKARFTYLHDGATTPMGG